MSQALPSYLTTAQADALAPTLWPRPARYLGAPAADRAPALAAATARVDARPYQGRRVDAGQRLQFPRVPYADGSDVWDLAGPDADGQYAIVVPAAVLAATLCEADALLDAERAATTRDAQLGRLLKRDRTGGQEEEYELAGALAAAGGGSLCAQAETLLRPYRLRTGRLL